MANINLSEQFLVSFHSPSKSPEPGDCWGGSSNRALTEIKNDGIVEEKVVPYASSLCLRETTSTIGCANNLPMPECKADRIGPGWLTNWTTTYCNQTCALKDDNGNYFHCASPMTRPALTATAGSTHLWKIAGYVRPTGTTLGDYTQLGPTIKRALVCHGPLNAATGQFPGGSHEFLLIGWNNTFGTNGAWIIKNSWGAGWIAGGRLGSAGPGFAYIPYFDPAGELVNYTFSVQGVS
jgi:hypothetical protein